MKRVTDNVKSFHIFLRDFDACRIAIAILDSSDSKALIIGCPRYQANNDFKRGERDSSPVDGNEGKELMPNLVPFAGCMRANRATHYWVGGTVYGDRLPLLRYAWDRCRP